MYHQYNNSILIETRKPDLSCNTTSTACTYYRSPLATSTTMFMPLTPNRDHRRPSFAEDGADMSHYADSSLGTSSLSMSKISETIDIVVIGDEGANKAKFISSFLNNGIGEDPTSADITCRRSVMIQSGTYNVNIHTTVGQEDFWGINDVYFRQGHGFIFVYNVNSRESFNMFSTLRDKIMYDKSSENILMSIVGYGESDTESREVTYAEAKRLADLYSCSFTELVNFDRESENLIYNCVSDLLGRITNFQSNNNNSSNGGAAGNAGNAASGGSSQNQKNTEVLVLGDIFVGKTQIIKRLLGNSFSYSYNETTEWTKNVCQKLHNDVRYFIKFMDTRGLDLEQTISRERLVNTQGFVFIYSVASRESFNLLDVLRRKVLSSKSDSKIPAVIVANKSDTLHRQVSVEEGKELAARWGCPFFEVSALNSEEETIGKSISQLLVEIQKQNNNNIDIGEFKKEGYLMKEGKKLKMQSMTKYFFKIKKGTLQYSKTQQISNKKIKSLELSEQIQVQIVGGSGGDKREVWPFQIIDPINQYHMNLIANSESERDSWITAIKINCYVNEAINTIVDDVVKTMASEIISQTQNLTHKRSDSVRSSSSSVHTPMSPSPLYSSHLMSSSGESVSPSSSPNFESSSSSLNGSSPPSWESLSSSSSSVNPLNSSHSSLHQTHSSVIDQLQQLNASPLKKNNFLQRTTSFNKAKSKN
eukprot:gene7557-9291_t